MKDLHSIIIASFNNFFEYNNVADMNTESTEN